MQINIKQKKFFKKWTKLNNIIIYFECIFLFRCYRGARDVLQHANAVISGKIVQNLRAPIRHIPTPFTIFPAFSKFSPPFLVFPPQLLAFPLWFSAFLPRFSAFPLLPSFNSSIRHSGFYRQPNFTFFIIDQGMWCQPH